MFARYDAERRGEPGQPEDEKLGRERYFRYLERFGFGRPTSVDLPGEVGGIMRPLDRWAQIDLATSSFGQGISVTAMQLTAAFAAIANGGRLHQPYLLERAVDGDGKVLLAHEGGFGDAASRAALESAVADRSSLVRMTARAALRQVR